MEQRARRETASSGGPAAGRPVSGIAMEDGAVTLEATFALTLLVPVLFAILQFGGALQRWSAQDAIAVQGARQAAELGGDSPALRLAIESSLRSSGIDPASVTVSVSPRWSGGASPSASGSARRRASSSRSF